MWRWLLLAFVIAFIVGQVTRLLPSARDRQLAALRAAAAASGVRVRFWTARQSGYTYPRLPESGFLYQLPWPPNREPDARWALWQPADGEGVILSGRPPALAGEWLASFRQRFPDAWALLECSPEGLGLLWLERGTVEDTRSLVQALDLLQKSL